METYGTGIEFNVNKKIKRCEIAIGLVNCIFIEKENTTVSFSNRPTYCYGISLQSPGVDEAIECLELICAAKSIMDSYIEMEIDHFASNIYNSECQRLGRECFLEHLTNAVKISDVGMSWYKAIILSENAYVNIHEKIAVLKYYNARLIYDIHPMDLHPDYFVPFNLTLLNKLRIAYSIIDLHSIIEELGLEIKASREEPSVNGDQWNEKVLKDLERRLRGAGIDPDKLIPWLSREEQKRPFKSNVINSSSLCSWSDDDRVFDFEISIKNAILELDFQRDKLASHGVGERVNNLSVVDLENAFSLLRVLLLDYFGISLCDE